MPPEIPVAGTGEEKSVPFNLIRTKDAGNLGSGSGFPLTSGALYITLGPQFPPLGNGENKREGWMTRMQCEQGARPGSTATIPHPFTPSSPSLYPLYMFGWQEASMVSSPGKSLSLFLHWPRTWAAGRAGDLAMWSEQQGELETLQCGPNPWSVPPLLTSQTSPTCLPFLTVPLEYWQVAISL